MPEAQTPENRDVDPKSWNDTMKNDPKRPGCHNVNQCDSSAMTAMRLHIGETFEARQSLRYGRRYCTQSTPSVRQTEAKNGRRHVDLAPYCEGNRTVSGEHDTLSHRRALASSWRRPTCSTGMDSKRNGSEDDLRLHVPYLVDTLCHGRHAPRGIVGPNESDHRAKIICDVRERTKEHSAGMESADAGLQPCLSLPMGRA